MRIFNETQRFIQPWLIIVLLISLVTPISIIAKQWFATNKSFEANLEYLLVIVILFISVSIIFIFKLNTRIDTVGIHYKFSPVHLKPS